MTRTTGPRQALSGPVSYRVARSGAPRRLRAAQCVSRVSAPHPQPFPGRAL
jgi:hypothetical protein